ncbi:hypothetical protein CQA53_10855 [Helicobacter didelphidarum]|uniref:Uncharacterized protein n=1 Tax=Helicobacter didelphidarum TaxID=2040648 RepID=A0A3D8I6F1_9HELI|nr:hypothetical protein [Helicobacter didelphidarum]RDU60586.1 hypothetical protein CQA53_10855 [Helicobacter didelphidarum]
MNKKFNFGKFILDCIISFIAIIISMIAFGKLLYYFYFLVGKSSLGLFRCSWYDIALELSITSFILPLILYKFYKFYKISFIICCVISIAFVWLCAYGFCNSAGIK